MTKRERLEDLGILAEKLDNLCDDILFDLLDRGRTKDYPHIFKEMSENAQYEELNNIAYGIQRVSETIHDCMWIARGEDNSS